MNTWKILAGAAGLAGVALAVAPAWSEDAAPAAAPGAASAVIKDAAGKELGVVKLKAAPRGLFLSAKLSGLTPGVHAFHIHEKGVCEGDFKSAGGHFNPTHAKHGFMSEGGLHAGDMPNLDVPDSGSVDMELFLPDVSLTPGAEGNLLDADGSAFVVHAGPDDYMSDPAGNAGARVACGVVQPAE
jgi:Cu-Zn family superoxide dismutase